MSGRLTGLVAVVTGAGRPGGLGAAIARRLCLDGAAVVVSDLSPDTARNTETVHLGSADGLAEVAASLVQAGGRSDAVLADVTEFKDMQRLAARAVERYGRLDIWVNNAGIGYKMTPLLETDPADWRSVIDVNLTGCFFGLRSAAAVMVAQGQGGRIINIASQAAKSGFPFAQAYCASKHGLVGLARSAAIELGAHGITVNNVCPNHVTTGLGAWQNEYFASKTGRSVETYLADMRARIPLGRVGLAEDTAAAVAFLASVDASYITAESLNVSGGEEPH